MPAEPRTVRAVLTGRRLLIGLAVALLLPATLGVVALAYRPPAPPPTTSALRHPSLPQTPDSVAVTQLERSAVAARAARKLPAPRLLSPESTGSAGPGALPTLVVAPRTTPYSLAELRTLVPAAFSDVVGPDGAAGVDGTVGAVLLTAHVEVPAGATLLIDARTPDVRLSSGPSGFATLISRGTTTVQGTAATPVQISTWDPQRRAPDSDPANGRSFVLQIGGRMDVDHGRFHDLGFGTGTSSGVTWRGAGPEVEGATANTPHVRSQGTVTGSVFERNHFGAYTHEAQGMRWVDNTFRDNEEYGFDPHDFSTGFLVEGNVAHHNGKHGFIFSRGCNDNVLRDNTAYANHGHGFMIDDGRSAASATAQVRLNASNDNVVAGNTAYDNAGSGVELEGGRGNTVTGNRLTHNDIGVRVKDRAVATVSRNVIDDSVRYGVHVLDPVSRAAIADNRISGSWAAIDLASPASAAVGVNPSTDVTTPLVVDGVAVHDPSWTERAVQYLRWNPVLVLWGLVLGVPTLVALLRAPVRLRRRRMGTV